MDDPGVEMEANIPIVAVIDGSYGEVRKDDGEGDDKLFALTSLAT